MNNVIKNAIVSACSEFMTPVVRLLLKNGIGYREFSEICKAAFVEVASDDYGIRGRKTNMSRVAVMTGLSRKEIRKIRDSMESGEFGSVARTRRPELVLSLWHTDAEFLDGRHSPKPIFFDGDGSTFCSLVDRVGGDIPPRAMLIELLRAGSVIEEGAMLRAVSRSYVPEPHDPQAILVAGGAIRDLVSTIHHNLGCEDPEDRLLERRVYSEKLPRSQRYRFKKLARDKGQLLLQDLNSWLSERAFDVTGENVDDSDDGSQRIGVGIYFFDHTVAASRGQSEKKT